LNCNHAVRDKKIAVLKMNVKTFYVLMLTGMVVVACQNPVRETPSVTDKSVKGTFEYDLAFLSKKDKVIVLADGDAQVIVSAKYQGKVFTSSAEGLKGKSFGWINYDAFDKSPDPHMNAYGGENRLWLGPEGNKFSLFFKPSAEMTFENWKTPPPIDTEEWNVVSKDERSVSLSKAAQIGNYAGSTFDLTIKRAVSILSHGAIEQSLGITMDEKLKAVGYRTANEIVNTGKDAWTRETGAPCIWILDMFNPSLSTTIIVPFKTEGSGKIATTDYFGEISPDRINISNNLLLFKADGKSRGKIGLSPSRAKSLAGSYDEENNILTVVTYDLDENATYLNQEWSTSKDPYSGDAVNAYNDGPLEDGSQMGPFYELESVSPAAFLAPGEKLSHMHNVFHFTGDREQVRDLLNVLFGITDPKL
jgi:hypothetical protein